MAVCWNWNGSGGIWLESEKNQGPVSPCYLHHATETFLCLNLYSPFQKESDNKQKLDTTPRRLGNGPSKTNDAPATLDDAKEMAMTCQRSQRATKYSRQARLLHDMEERDIQPMEINQMAYQQHQALKGTTRACQR